MTEYSKAFEKEGITKTVMRAGRYKALGNPYEPLSEDGKAEIQAKLDDLYQLFMGTVARNRGTTAIIADQVMGQGREFLGKRGLDADWSMPSVIWRTPWPTRRLIEHLLRENLPTLGRVQLLRLLKPRP